MSAWDLYTERIVSMGETQRNVAKIRETRYITNKLKNNLSYQIVDIDNTKREVAIINSDNLNEKRIISMPGERLVCGAIVSWMDNKWLITELDANSTIYMRAKMVQCNHLLKWVSGDGVIHEQWSIVEDGTKLFRDSFGVGKPAYKYNLSNCWKILKLFVLQHKSESFKCECGESRKKQIDDIRSNPKYLCNGRSAAKFRKEKVQRPSVGSRRISD